MNITKLRTNLITSSVVASGPPSPADVATFQGHEVGWEQTLHFASQSLNISSDPRDFLLYPVPIMYSGLPNRNGVAFPLDELLKWNPERGCQAYKTWAGMPMFKEHKADILRDALGMVVDVSMRKIEKFSRGVFWKVLALAAIDRTKEPEYAEKIEKGEINTYSMGALVDYCSCSYCGAEVGKCNHIDADPNKVTFYEKSGKVVFKNVHGINGQELSSVVDPAFPTAISDTLIRY